MIGYQKSTQLSRVEPKKSQLEINIQSNKDLDVIYKLMGLYGKCEVMVAKNCLRKEKVSSVNTLLKMTYAHKYKRIYYKNKKNRQKLSSLNHTLSACIPCHQVLEYDKKLTEEMFKKLRPVKNNKKG